MNYGIYLPHKTEKKKIEKRKKKRKKQIIVCGKVRIYNSQFVYKIYLFHSFR